MSLSTIGANDVSEETQCYKDKLASKDAQIAAHETRLMRQAAQLEELKATFIENMHKLSGESDRALKIERDLVKTRDDLRNEKNTSKNLETALSVANDRAKAKELEVRELENFLQTMSHRSEGLTAQTTRIEKDNLVLASRVRELQSLQQPIFVAPTPGRNRIGRPRSSSLSDFRITNLEQELNALRVSLTNKDRELNSAQERATRFQNDLLRVDNEKASVERKLGEEIERLRSFSEEQYEENAFLKGQLAEGNGRSREAELLDRIEEDGAKIAMLEELIGDDRELKSLKDKLLKAERKLASETKKLIDSEDREIGLVREKEDALDRLEQALSEIGSLKNALEASDSQIEALESKHLEDSFQMVDHEIKFDDKLIPEPTGRPSTPNKAEVADVERLLTAIDRLRGERDELKRSLEFLEAEQKFARESRDMELDLPNPPAVVEGLRHELQTERQRSSALLRHLKYLRLASSALTLVVEQTHVWAESGAQEFSHISELYAQTRRQNREIGSTLETLGRKVQDLESDLQKSGVTLETALHERDSLKCQVDQLETRLQERVTEIEHHKSVHVEAQGTTLHAQRALQEASNSLEDLESERDSLKLQATNLLRDLELARKELSEAESRYSTLQFQQLSTMSNNEATRALRSQIQELEGRVERRTEQIGIHQHDIRRLETNLKLQEERVSEMTNELETAVAEKEAMVEDCAAAREARDEAVRRVEALEVEVEVLEGRSVGMENLSKMVDTSQKELRRLESAEGDSINLVQVVFSLIAEFKSTLSVAGRKETDLVGRLQIAEVECANAVQKSTDLASDNDRLSSERFTAIHEVEYLQQQFQSSEKERQSAMLALATFHSALLNKSELLRSSTHARTKLLEHISTLEGQLSLINANFDDLQSQLAAKLQELELVNRELHQVVSEGEARGVAAAAEIADLKKELAERTSELANMQTSDDLDGELEQARLMHLKELCVLKDDLNSLTAQLQDANRRCDEAKGHATSAKEEATRSVNDLEVRLQEALTKVDDHDDLRSRLSTMAADHNKTLEEMKEEMKKTASDVEDSRRGMEELRSQRDRALDELEGVKKDLEEQVTQVLSRKQELEDQVAKHEAVSEQLEASRKDLRKLEQQILETVQTHQKTLESSTSELSGLRKRVETAEESKSILQQNLDDLSKELVIVRSSEASLKEEKLTQQTEVTNLEAEIQRMVTSKRFLENQVAHSEQKTASLQAALAKAQADSAILETTAKKAEASLAMQSIQHENATAALRREINVLRTKPSFETEVKEQNLKIQEMEELLRNKCAEIEGNDDHVIELLKEQKKLKSKVESLTRKVQGLQSKLEAAKSRTIVPESVTPSPPPPIPQPSAIPPVPSQEVGRSRQSLKLAGSAPLTKATSDPSSSRVSLAASALPRPKTPERRSQPVFKARTPERHSAPSLASAALIPEVFESLPSESSIGKKRRAPDDFEDGHGMPSQAFTVDSLPSEKSSTPPRSQRAFQLHSGFTPVRNMGVRSTVGQTIRVVSPKRAVSAISRGPPPIADVTNSPRSSSGPAVPSKRSWLGKIRGTGASQSSSRTTRPPVFENNS